MVTGHGRSGTNWLLGLLDCSAQTHCRNDPYLDPASPLARLPGRFVVGTAADELAADWDDAIAWTAAHFGAGDQPIPTVKHHLHGLSCRLGLPQMVQRARLRRWAAVFSPSLRRMEWPVPWWLGSAAKLKEAVPVLRTSQVPGWVCWALAHRPAVRVLHIVRHPGGFLNSWRNRFLRGRDPAEVHAANLTRLGEVAATNPHWARRFGDLQHLSLEASELWYWRYATEALHAAGADRDTYRRVIYEELAAEPVAGARGLYEFCGLPWTAHTERLIRKRSTGSRGIAEAWRERLDADARALVEEILNGSPMAEWWNDTGSAPD
jgi:hypothetical protein